MSLCQVRITGGALRDAPDALLTWEVKSVDTRFEAIIVAPVLVQVRHKSLSQHHKAQ
jgi:hypothetical protein